MISALQAKGVVACVMGENNNAPATVYVDKMVEKRDALKIIKIPFSTSFLNRTSVQLI